MDRVITADGLTMMADCQEVFTVIAGFNGNDYIVEIDDATKKKTWHLYMPPDENEDDLKTFEGPMLAIVESQIKTSMEKHISKPKQKCEQPLEETVVVKDPAKKKKSTTKKQTKQNLPTIDLEKETYNLELNNPLPPIPKKKIVFKKK